MRLRRRIRRIGRWLRLSPKRAQQAVLFVLVMACGALVLRIAMPPAPVPPAPLPVTNLDLVKTRITKDVTVPRGRWTRIVVHHSATVGGNAARFDEYHRRAHGWDGLAYHFVIGNGNGSGDGEVEIGEHWWKQEWGTHVRGHNEGALGICLVGNFDEMTGDPPRPSVPSERQIEALVTLTQALLDLTGLTAANVVGHSDIIPTDCPGRYFPMQAFRARVAARR